MIFFFFFLHTKNDMMDQNGYYVKMYIWTFSLQFHFYKPWMTHEGEIKNGWFNAFICKHLIMFPSHGLVKAVCTADALTLVRLNRFVRCMLLAGCYETVTEKTFLKFGVALLKVEIFLAPSTQSSVGFKKKKKKNLLIFQHLRLKWFTGTTSCHYPR